MKSVFLTIGLLAVLGVETSVNAEIIDSSATGFLARSRVVINSTPDKVYKTIVGQVGNWWNADHTYSGDAGNLSIDARPGGCFCEKLPDSGGVQHMTVIFASPGKTLRLSGGLGPLQGSGLSGVLTLSLDTLDQKTTLELVYSVGGFFQGGLQVITGPVDQVLLEQITRLKTYIETGRPEKQ